MISGFPDFNFPIFCLNLLTTSQKASPVALFGSSVRAPSMFINFPPAIWANEQAQKKKMIRTYAKLAEAEGSSAISGILRHREIMHRYLLLRTGYTSLNGLSKLFTDDIEEVKHILSDIAQAMTVQLYILEVFF